MEKLDRVIVPEEMFEKNVKNFDFFKILMAIGDALGETEKELDKSPNPLQNKERN